MLNTKSVFHCHFIIILLIGMTTVLRAEGLPPLTHNLTAMQPDIISPELYFKDMDDESINLKDLRGKVVVINFWATWCPPCRREMSSLEKLYQATKDKNIELLAVNIGEDDDSIFSFLGEIEPPLTFKILLDKDGISMKKWKVRGLPTTYIVAPDGTIAYRAVGGREFSHPDIVNKIKELMDKKIKLRTDEHVE